MERGAYRIIDANFNRAREAVRVMEEFCRFVLDCEPLTARCKKLRHQLCDAVGRLEGDAMVASRDTVRDVGVEMSVQGQLGRASVYDSFKAACKRLTEALRAITEACQAEVPQVAAAVERLRYDAYTLEKDIVVFSRPVRKWERVRLYVLITSNLPVEVVRLTQACAAGGADCIQLRAKGMADDAMFALAREFAGLCAEANVLSIVNDRVDIAIAAGADGVHLGVGDLGVEQARALQLKPLITGKTTHNAGELSRAIDERPTYVSLGPVFATATKPELRVEGMAYVKEGLDMLEGTGIGHVAIGGITAENLADVLQAGVKTVAVCSHITEAADVAGRCRRLKAGLWG